MTEAPGTDFVTVRLASGHAIRVFAQRLLAGEVSDFGTLEAVYVRRLMAEVRPGDVVYDVGSSTAEFAAAVAQVTGGSAVHLFESSPWHWPRMRATWEANGLAGPGGCFDGFAANASRPGWQELLARDGAWPTSAGGALVLIDGFTFVEERPDLSAVTLEDYVASGMAPPSVLMLDVEGSEGVVLSGLGSLRPRLIFVSLHPEVGFLDRYGWTQGRVHRFLAELGYRSELLGADHEEHWVFAR